MLCLRSSRGVTAALKSSTIAWAVKAPAAPATRTFTSLTPLRPSIFPSNLSAFRTPSVTAPVASSSAAESALDLLPKISSNPAFAGIQVRCGPRNTFSPSHFVRKRRHGFLSRINTRKGRALLQRRKNKRRSTLSH